MVRDARGRRRLPLPPLRSVLLVGAGGAVGGLGRAAVGVWAPVEAGAFPWSTFAENLAGAFLLGFVLTLLLEGVLASQWMRPLIAIGVLGAFTTFATLAYELYRLLADAHVGVAATYAIATAACGLAMAMMGVVSARAITRRRRV